jgi:hypothetical protein
MATTKTVTPAALTAAERFIQLNARLIDRHRFAYHVRGGPAEPVVAVLRAYANPDGGFGNALEPDLRGAASQPLPAQHALEILHEVDAIGDPMVPRLLDYLASITAADGGVPFVLPAAKEAPHAPWWQSADSPVGSLVPTASLAGQLYRDGLNHSWLAPATDFCWAEIDKLSEAGGYNAIAVLTFLDHVPDRDRAEVAFERLRGSILTATELDPTSSGEAFFPLDFAPHPDGFGRRVFDDDVIERHLDALVEAQEEDGGWKVNFLIWTPITGHDWNAFLTIERLKTLKAYGRVSDS